MPSLRIAVVIPARMASSRFPGKPLLEVRGLSMIEHVRRRALLAKGFSEVVVATCDADIAARVKRHGGKVVLTSPAHAGALDRVAEAVGRLDCTHGINLQGDEILVLPEDLEWLASAISREPEGSAWNAVASIDHPSELADRAIVKCIITRSKRIQFCARDLSALGLDPPRFEPARKILGILAYGRDFIGRYGSMERTPLERAESIDQSRILEHDESLRAVEFTKGYPSINVPRDLDLVEEFLEKDPRQRDVLDLILRM